MILHPWKRCDTPHHCETAFQDFLTDDSLLSHLRDRYFIITQCEYDHRGINLGRRGVVRDSNPDFSYQRQIVDLFARFNWLADVPASERRGIIKAFMQIYQLHMPEIFLALSDTQYLHNQGLKPEEVVATLEAQTRSQMLPSVEKVFQDGVTGGEAAFTQFAADLPCNPEELPAYWNRLAREQNSNAAGAAAAATAAAGAAGATAGRTARSASTTPASATSTHLPLTSPSAPPPPPSAQRRAALAAYAPPPLTSDTVARLLWQPPNTSTVTLNPIVGGIQNDESFIYVRMNFCLPVCTYLFNRPFYYPGPAGTRAAALAGAGDGIENGRTYDNRNYERPNLEVRLFKTTVPYLQAPPPGAPPPPQRMVRGLFTLKDISEGAPISDYTGYIQSTRMFCAQLSQICRRNHAAQDSLHTYLLPSPVTALQAFRHTLYYPPYALVVDAQKLGSEARYVRFSQDQSRVNAVVRRTFINSQLHLQLHAKRQIQAGEEIILSAEHCALSYQLPAIAGGWIIPHLELSPADLPADFENSTAPGLEPMTRPATPDAIRPLTSMDQRLSGTGTPAAGLTSAAQTPRTSPVPVVPPGEGWNDLPPRERSESLMAGAVSGIRGTAPLQITDMYLSNPNIVMNMDDGKPSAGAARGPGTPDLSASKILPPPLPAPAPAFAPAPGSCLEESNGLDLASIPRPLESVNDRFTMLITPLQGDSDPRTGPTAMLRRNPQAVCHGVVRYDLNRIYAANKDAFRQLMLRECPQLDPSSARELLGRTNFVIGFSNIQSEQAINRIKQFIMAQPDGLLRSEEANLLLNTMRSPTFARTYPDLAASMTQKARKPASARLAGAVDAPIFTLQHAQQAIFDHERFSFALGYYTMDPGPQEAPELARTGIMIYPPYFHFDLNGRLHPPHPSKLFGLYPGALQPAARQEPPRARGRPQRTTPTISAPNGNTNAAAAAAAAAAPAASGAPAMLSLAPHLGGTMAQTQDTFRPVRPYPDPNGGATALRTTQGRPTRIATGEGVMVVRAALGLTCPPTPMGLHASVADETVLRAMFTGYVEGAAVGGAAVAGPAAALQGETPTLVLAEGGQRTEMISGSVMNVVREVDDDHIIFDNEVMARKKNLITEMSNAFIRELKQLSQTEVEVLRRQAEVGRFVCEKMQL